MKIIPTTTVNLFFFLYVNKVTKFLLRSKQMRAPCLRDIVRKMNWEIYCYDAQN